MLRPNERKKIIEEEDAKPIEKAQEGHARIIKLNEPKKKKSSVAQLEATQSPPARATLVGHHWEIVPNASPKFSVPATPTVAAPASEQHRPALRELVKQKIRELEFKVASFSHPLQDLSQKRKLHGIPRQKPPLTKNGKTSKTKVFGM